MSSITAVAAELKDPEKRASRARGAQLDLKIHAAARKILVERGYDGLNFDAIAREAGVSRPTLYRRWPNKMRLLEELTVGGRSELSIILEAPDLKSSIAYLLQSVARHYMEPWMRSATIGTFASGSIGDQYPSGAMEQAETAARLTVSLLVEKAKQQGTMRQDVDADALYDLAVGPVIYRILFSFHGNIEELHLHKLLDMIMWGVSA